MSSNSPRLLSWRLASSALVVLAGGMLFGTSAERLRGLEMQIEGLDASARLEQLERRSLVDDVDENLQHLQSELLALRDGLTRALAAAAGDEVLIERLEETEARLVLLDKSLAGHAGTLATLRENVDVVANEELPALIAEREARLELRYEGLQTLLASTRQVAEASMAEVDTVRRMAERDLSSMWRDLVGPVVQLAGKTSVGSGVLLESEPTGDGHRTLVLTAWHVVRDILADEGGSESVAIPVTIYREDGTIQSETAQLICRNADLDAALLVLNSTARFDCGARLAGRKQLEEVTIFERIYAVGCPLGNDPIPTYGEVATCRHIIDGTQYWMINAPTYIGNSGGGIFDSETHELLGIFSKIYTHGSLRPTIVPHMGLVTPLHRIYDWLITEGYALDDTSGTGLRIATSER